MAGNFKRKKFDKGDNSDDNYSPKPSYEVNLEILMKWTMFLFIAFLVSLPSLAESDDLMIYNGNYEPNERYCGRHFEVSGNTLIATVTEHREYGCNNDAFGKVVIFRCDEDFICNPIDKNLWTKQLVLLEDGNILRITSRNISLRYYKIEERGPHPDYVPSDEIPHTHYRENSTRRESRIQTFRGSAGISIIDSDFRCSWGDEAEAKQLAIEDALSNCYAAGRNICEVAVATIKFRGDFYDLYGEVGKGYGCYAEAIVRSLY